MGQSTSRVLLLTDTSSRIPVTIQPSGQRAILAGDNTIYPPIDFLENPDLVRPGDRVVSSGDGGMFPADLLVGQVTMSADGRLRIRLAADYERLEFLRVLRSHEAEVLDEAGRLIVPEPREVFGPPARAAPRAPSGQKSEGGSDAVSAWLARWAESDRHGFAGLPGGLCLACSPAETRSFYVASSLALAVRL